MFGASSPIAVDKSENAVIILPMTTENQDRGHSFRPAEFSQKNFADKTPVELRADFRETYRNYERGCFPLSKEGQAAADADREVSAYEVIFDPLNQIERHRFTTRFSLRAAAAGFEIVAAITTPGVGFKDKEGEHPLTAITYILKSPKD